MKRRTLLKAPVIAVGAVALPSAKEVLWDRSRQDFLTAGIVTVPFGTSFQSPVEPGRYRLYKLPEPITPKAVRNRLRHIEGCDYIRLETLPGLGQPECHMFVPRACIAELGAAKYTKFEREAGIVCVITHPDIELGSDDEIVGYTRA